MNVYYFRFGCSLPIRLVRHLTTNKTCGGLHPRNFIINHLFIFLLTGGYFTIFGDESSYADHFNARLVTGEFIIFKRR